MRHYFDKYGGNLGQTGCVSYMFEDKGVIAIEAEGIEATEEDFENLCKKLAEENNMELDTVKGLVDEAGAKLDIKLNKAADVIYNSGADLPWSEEAEAQTVLDAITE